jgi:hypothetical protein
MVKKEQMYKGLVLGEERALYGLNGALVEECKFCGEEDGESALKECRDIDVRYCDFSLRYPLWHCEDFVLSDCRMSEGVRAPIWYSKRGRFERCEMYGVKALRECEDITLSHVTAVSTEFGWRCRGISIDNSNITGEYFLFECHDVKIDSFTLTGKYSFQYTENVEICNSTLNTKDAFWHAKNVTLRNCTIRGEYLAWYSEGLTLINCHISGTQPLCYCKNLTLIGCTTEGCDLSFEYSEVNAEIVGDIVSVKNPLLGRIVADSIGEIVTDGSVRECRCEIVTK